MKRKVATPAGTARAEDPALSAAKEAAEAVPAESVHLERNDLENGMFLDSMKKETAMCCLLFNNPLSNYKISAQILIAVPRIKSANIHCKYFVFIFWPSFAPSGAAKRLATIITAAGP